MRQERDPALQHAFVSAVGGSNGITSGGAVGSTAVVGGDSFCETLQRRLDAAIASPDERQSLQKDIIDNLSRLDAGQVADVLAKVFAFEQLRTLALLEEVVMILTSSSVIKTAGTHMVRC